MPLKAESTVIMAAVTQATTNMEMAEITLMMLRDLRANR
jgi:hypothetical protein